MFKRILVPVDGSDTATHALQEAINLVKDQGAQLRLVHVVDEVNINLETEYAIKEFVEALHKSGRAILAKAEALAHAAGIPTETGLLELTPMGRHIADAIIEEAARWPADLIVIGTHGRRGINRLLLGSVAEKVVHGATTPVLLIRGQ